MYASVTAALMIGALADRGRIIPALVFLFIWATVVYSPIACWSWNPNGWAATLGYLDYAGGTPVHITAGFGALAYSLVLGRRSAMDAIPQPFSGASSLFSFSSHRHNRQQEQQQQPQPDQQLQQQQNNNNDLEKANQTFNAIMSLDSRPHSVMLVVIGTAFMWAGWIGFNGGASIIPTLRSLQAIFNTNISAAFGGLAWALLDFRIERRWSVIGLCSGIISGLVCITPAAGFVPTWAAVIFGIVGSLSANISTKFKYLVGIDDSLDIFAVHGVCGVVGNILTALFTSKTVASLDGVTEINGGWLDHHYVQLWFQIAGTLASSAYAFVVTAVLLIIINRIPGLHLRISKEEEEAGLDVTEHDEFAYDYVEIIRDLPVSDEDIWPRFLPSSPNHQNSELDNSNNVNNINMNHSFTTPQTSSGQQHFDSMYRSGSISNRTSNEYLGTVPEQNESSLRTWDSYTNSNNNHNSHHHHNNRYTYNNNNNNSNTIEGIIEPTYENNHNGNISMSPIDSNNEKQSYNNDNYFIPIYDGQQEDNYNKNNTHGGRRYNNTDNSNFIPNNNNNDDDFDRKNRNNHNHHKYRHKIISRISRSRNNNNSSHRHNHNHHYNLSSSLSPSPSPFSRSRSLSLTSSSTDQIIGQDPITIRNYQNNNNYNNSQQQQHELKELKVFKKEKEENKNNNNNVLPSPSNSSLHLSSSTNIKDNNNEKEKIENEKNDLEISNEFENLSTNNNNNNDNNDDNDNNNNKNIENIKKTSNTFNPNFKF